jgi:hypothetical protein
MTDATLPLLGENGVSPVMMTGEIVYNCRKNMQEYEQRQGKFGADGLVHISHIGRGDFVFIRKGMQPTRMGGFGDSEWAIDVFAGFDGCLHEDDDVFQLVGVARGPPMHQDMLGRETMEAIFAVQIGGTRTVICRARQVIPIGSWLVWQLPRADGLPPDASKHGRILAEIVEFKPQNAMVQAEEVHKRIRDQMDGKIDLTVLHSSARKAFQNAWKIWEGLSAIAFTSIVTYLETVGGARISDNAKLDIAEFLDVIEINRGNAAAITNKQQTKKKVTSALLDNILQCETDPATGNSRPSDNTTAFPFATDGARNPRANQNEASRRQAAQYEQVYTTMLVMYHSLFSRRFAWTLNGGVPGADFDVAMSRL